MSEDTTLEIYRGDDVSWDLIFKDSEGVPIDITGYTFFFTVKENKADTDDEALITKTVDTHTDPTNGETEINLSSTLTNITPGLFWYDIQQKDNIGKIKTLVVGRIRVHEDITNRTE